MYLLNSRRNMLPCMNLKSKQTKKNTLLYIDNISQILYLVYTCTKSEGYFNCDRQKYYKSL